MNFDKLLAFKIGNLASDAALFSKLIKSLFLLHSYITDLLFIKINNKKIKKLHPKS